MKRTLWKSIKRINYIHGPSIAGAIFALFCAALELACGYTLGVETWWFVFTWHVALVCVAVAMLTAFSIYRFERKHA